MPEAPGSDLDISNAGFIVFYDHSHHFNGELTIHICSKRGKHLLSQTFKGASLFGFSPAGNKFGISDNKKSSYNHYS